MGLFGKGKNEKANASEIQFVYKIDGLFWWGVTEDSIVNKKRTILFSDITNIDFQKTGSTRGLSIRSAGKIYSYTFLKEYADTAEAAYLYIKAKSGASGVNDKRIQERQEEFKKSVLDPLEAHIASIKNKLHAAGFNGDARFDLFNKAVQKPKEDSPYKNETTYLKTMSMLWDSKSRRIAFVWFDDSERIIYINSESIIKCEVIQNGTEKKDNFSIGNFNNNIYTSTDFSTSTTYLDNLGLKFTLRDPANPLLTIPIVTSRINANSAEARESIDFVEKAFASISAIIS